MPNWCENAITIDGDDESLDALWEVIKPVEEGDPADLTKAFPCPEPLKQTMAGFMAEDDEGYATWVAQKAANIAEYGSADWYDWCNRNWGTKWSPDFDYNNSDTLGISLWGNSAWSPPIELLQNVSRQYPSLTFTIVYSEMGCDFVGAAVVRAGVIVGDSSGEISPHVTVDYDSDEYFEIVNETVIALREQHLASACSMV